MDPDMQPEEARLKQEAEEAREKMLAGEETPWLDRDTHRGESPHTEGGEYLDPVDQSPGGMSGGANFGTSGAHQGSATPRGHGGASRGGSRRGHGGDIPGAFGEETGGPENVSAGEGPRDNAIRKLQDVQ